ncbi:enoyl-CoA hydratase-related protein [Streptomyces sp. NPDC051219]|uniref:enoyl-CoA hydratase-related protein n=1 Tax=Streptomyces sp. NPDC051219 TaxID=3155283 RepID=UPI0034191D8D
MFDNLTIDTDERIAVVTMDRPPVNAIDQSMYGQIADLFGHADVHLPDVDVVILTSQGRHFCGGNDLTEFMTMNPDNVAGRMAVVHAAFWAIYQCAVPVIAAVDGVAAGTGLAIAGSCDLVVASDRARFGLPEISVGAMGGAKHLSRLVPQGVVRRMFYTADLVDARELAAFGGIAAITTPEDLVTTARQVGRSIARHSPVAIRIAKRSLNAIEYMDLHDGYAKEQQFTGELSRFGDAKEAVAAFFDKREPRYTGS